MGAQLSDMYGEEFTCSDLVKFVKVCTKTLHKAEEIELMITGAVKIMKGKVKKEYLDQNLFGFLGGHDADILYLKKYSSKLFSPIISKDEWEASSRAYLEHIGIASGLTEIVIEVIKQEGYINVWLAIFFSLMTLLRSVPTDETVDNYKLPVILEADDTDIEIDKVDGVSLVQGIIYLATSTIRHKMTHNGLPFAVYHRAFFDGYIDKLHFINMPTEELNKNFLVGQVPEKAVISTLIKRKVLNVSNEGDILGTT